MGTVIKRALLGAIYIRLIAVDGQANVVRNFVLRGAALLGRHILNELVRQEDLCPVVVIGRHVRCQFYGPVEKDQAGLPITILEMPSRRGFGYRGSNVIDAFDPSNHDYNEH